ncbi:MAG: tRNA epoxyqueuosine(34) reductase QueG [Prolixibacteraceae bacterium]|jgi:epoxyqueuosine reductase|nr:tRNA epoxyqueuosine(34) reductase QueG [Prolixibacteraceae bacterium]
MTEIEERSEQIKQKALELGFLACGISRADFLPEEKKHLEEWLVERHNGEMTYMERNLDKRLDPRLLVENARSVVSVLLNYFSDKLQEDPAAPVISKYAYGRDYHFVMKDKLHLLLKYIREEVAPCNGRVFVDSAPVLDRTWASKAGLGWIGKNTNLISVEHGSFFFIGELVIDLELEPDEKLVRNHCGTCTRCIDACPTGAIVKPFVLDARKCISYQTIEKKGDLDGSLKGKFENRVFGCDICQDVCPWNLKSATHREPEFEPRPRLLQLTKEEWQQMDKPLFDELFKDSAVQRTGFNGLKRNLKFIDRKGHSM